MSIKTARDPYTVLFPMGLTMGLFGGGIWIPFAFGFSQNYPGLKHSHLMVGGFLLTYVQGFLMTALPQFLDSKRATLFEIFLAASLTVALVVSVLFGQFIWFYFFSSAIFFVLIIFAAPRFIKRQHSPPASFLFVGIGLFAGTFGSILMFLSYLEINTGLLFPVGRSLFFQGMILAFLLGVGSRLIPALMGFSPLPNVQIGKQVSGLSRSKTFFSLFAVLFLISFFLELLPNLLYGRCLRAFLTSFVLLMIWKIWKWPLAKTWLARGLWISSWFILIGMWGYALFPNQSIHLLHLMYVGGAGLMTILVSTRVTLAHGNHDLAAEKKSKALMATIGFALFAALTRATAGFIPAAYLSHLGYASICWVLALLFWAFAFGAKVLNSKNESEDC